MEINGTKWKLFGGQGGGPDPDGLMYLNYRPPPAAAAGPTIDPVPSTPTKGEAMPAPQFNCTAGTKGECLSKVTPFKIIKGTTDPAACCACGNCGMT